MSMFECESKFSCVSICGRLKISYLPYHQGAVFITKYNLQHQNNPSICVTVVHTIIMIMREVDMVVPNSTF